MVLALQGRDTQDQRVFAQIGRRAWRSTVDKYLRVDTHRFRAVDAISLLQLLNQLIPPLECTRQRLVLSIRKRHKSAEARVHGHPPP